MLNVTVANRSGGISKVPLKEDVRTDYVAAVVPSTAVVSICAVGVTSATVACGTLCAVPVVCGCSPVQAIKPAMPMNNLIFFISIYLYILCIYS